MNCRYASAFRTKTTFVDRKIVTRLEADDVIILNQQIHAALHGAVRAMRRHNLINDAVSLPTLVRRVVQVRSELLDHLF